MPDKAYLGDGVYVEVDRGMLKLTAENGIEATDTIYLEQETFVALQGYNQRVIEEQYGNDTPK